MLVSISPTPVDPIPRAAVIVAVPDVEMFAAVSRAVASEMLPAVAVMVTALLTVLIWPIATLLPAVTDTAPEPVL